MKTGLNPQNERRAGRLQRSLSSHCSNIMCVAGEIKDVLELMEPFPERERGRERWREKKKKKDNPQVNRFTPAGPIDFTLRGAGRLLTIKIIHWMWNLNEGLRYWLSAILHPPQRCVCTYGHGGRSVKHMAA